MSQPMASEYKADRLRQREWLLENYKRAGRNTLELMEQMRQEFPETVMARSTFQAWLKRFRKGNFDLNDGHRNGRPAKEKDTRVEKEIDKDPYITCIDIACILKSPWHRVKAYVRKQNLVSISGMWLRPMDDALREKRIEYCRQMIETHGEDLQMWNKVIFEGERIIYYNKGSGKRGEPVKKKLRCDNYESAEVDIKSVALHIWWTTCGYLHFRLVPMELRTNKNYQQELRELYADMESHGMIEEDGEPWTVHRNEDSKTSHCPKVLESLGWRSMLHPAHCPDLSPTDFHVFMKYMSAFSTYNNFENLQEIEEFSRRVFAKKKIDFYLAALDSLTERWHRVIETEGNFIGTFDKVE